MREVLKADGAVFHMAANEEIRRLSPTELRAANEDTFWRIRSDSPINTSNDTTNRIMRDNSVSASPHYGGAMPVH